MSENEKSTRWTFEMIFWSVLVLGALLYVSYGLLPLGDRLRESRQRLQAARQEVEQMEADLARVRSCTRALGGEEPSPDVIERELRNRLGYRREGEVRISLADE
jgi:hypothetical protein